MVRYSFEEKNRIVQQLTGTKYFKRDRELYAQYCSNLKLERDIKRANEFTYAKVDGRMIYELLDKVSEADIIANRQGEEKKPSGPISGVINQAWNMITGTKPNSGNIEAKAVNPGKKKEKVKGKSSRG